MVGAPTLTLGRATPAQKSLLGSSKAKALSPAEAQAAMIQRARSSFGASSSQPSSIRRPVATFVSSKR